MKKKIKLLKKLLAMSVVGGAVLFQAPTCTDQAQIITAASSLVTAAGVVYIVDRVVND